jgi:ribosome maturation factor RimP
MRTLIEPIVQDHGLELLDVERHQGRAPWRVRVVIDSPAGDGRVPVDRCAAVSREIAANLDATDAIPVAYQLEVTSPGLDRALTREKDFAAACGSAVKLETRRPIDGRRRFRGELIGFADGTATVAVDGEPVAVPFAEIARARIVYQFTRADFAASGGE